MTMFTISDIIQDISRGCARNNLNEDAFSYRIVYYTNERGVGTKHYEDCSYDGLRITLENIVRGNLTIANTVVFAAITSRKSGETVSLLSRPYAFSLNEYFQKICGTKEKEYISNSYGKRRMQCY